MERYDFDFKGFTTENKGEDTVLSYTQDLYIKILNDRERAIKDKIIEWCKDYAQTQNKNVFLYLMDEEVVKEIIDLGIHQYIEIHKGAGFRG